MATAIADRLIATHSSEHQHKRLDHLDALRGIAAIIVVAKHYVDAFGLPGWDRAMAHSPLGIWWDGPAAVSFFFVLSGLVLAFRHFRTTPTPDLAGFDYPGYIVARFCRIWLPYLAVLLITIPLVRLSAQGVATLPASTPWFASIWQGRITVGSLLRQVFDLRVVAAGDGLNLLIPQAWTLIVEVVMSLLIPCGVLIAARSTAWLLGTAFLAATLTGMSPFVLHFAIGIALAKHYRAIVDHLEPRPITRAALALVALLLATFDLYKPAIPPLTHILFDLDAQALGSALIIAVVSASPTLRNALARGLPHLIGRISFSLYLIHIIILFTLTPRLLHLMGRSSTTLNWTVGLAFTIAASVAVSIPLYRYVEVPTMALGKRITGRARSSPATQEEARGSEPIARIN
jgi:peptidoglycan/LPS O-acetylase OafA/YrhL